VVLVVSEKACATYDSYVIFELPNKMVYNQIILFV